MPPIKKTVPKTKPNNRRLIVLYCLGLLLAVSSALPAYTQSNFLKQFVDLELTSLFFVIANLATVVAILFYPRFIEKFSNYFSTKIILAIQAVALLGLVLANDPWSALLTIILFSVTSNLLWINMDILVENFSVYKTMGRTRTVYFTFINIGWILSPLLASYLISLGKYNLVFLVAAFLVVPVFLIFLRQGKNLQDKTKYSRENIALTLKNTWKNRNLRGIFFISLILQLFFSCAVVYVPIYLHQNLGMDWGVLGIIFSIMLIPFLIFEIPAGIIADKYIGEKEIMFIGLFIIAVSLFLFYNIETPTVWLWATVLFASRVGASLVEAMRETYFFKIIKPKDVGCINVFRTTTPLGYIIAPALAMLILAYFPLRYLFLFMAIITCSGFGFMTLIKDTK